MNVDLEEIKGTTHGLIIPIWLFIFSTGYTAIYIFTFVSMLYSKNIVGSHISKEFFLKSSIFTWSFWIIWVSIFEI